MDAGSEFHRASESPVEFMRLRALRLASSLGVDPGEALDCVGILENAFGVDWLNTAASDSMPAALPIRRHPLGSIVSTAGANQIAEVVELARYLRRLVSDPKLGAVIEGLRAQYDQTLLQLAFTDRFRAAGVQQLQLEPDALEGRVSDIRFTAENHPYRVECYRPTVRQSVVHEEGIRLAKTVLDSVASAPIVLSIAIALNEPLRPPIRKAVLRTIQAASHDLVAEVASKPDSFPAYTMSDTIGTISVCRGLATNPRHSPRHVVAPSFPKKEYDFDIFMRSDKTPRSKISGIDIDPHAGIGLSHCAIWFDDATRLENSLEKDLSAPLERLGRKIEQKLVQARSRTGDGRLLIVESWIAAQLPRASEQQIARLRGKIVDAHSNVSALLLVLRGWRPSQSRYAYEIHSLVSESANPAIRAMLQALEG